MQQCLGRHATNVQAGTAERGAAFYARRLQSQLARTDGCVVATGATTEYHDVIGAHGFTPGLKADREG
ncbi:hypothetical protein D9M73_284340 [compost metagenome]